MLIASHFNISKEAMLFKWQSLSLWEWKMLIISHFNILNQLSNWDWMTHICVSKLTIIGSDNGLSAGRCQAIIWTNAGKLLILNLGTNFRDILRDIHTFSLKKTHLKMSSVKWQQFCLSLNVSIGYWRHFDVWNILTVKLCTFVLKLGFVGRRVAWHGTPTTAWAKWSPACYNIF